MTFPASIRRQILARDGFRCVWPECDDPTGQHPPVGYKRGVEADHIVARRDGGPDTVENGRTLCSYHHELVSNAQKTRWANAPQVAQKHQAPVKDQPSRAFRRVGAALGTIKVDEALRKQFVRKGTPLPAPRRHFTAAQFEAACRRREEYAGDEAC